MPKIKFLKEKKDVEVPAGTNLRQAMLDHGIPVYEGIHTKLNCGGRGTCGSCRVYVKDGDKGLSPPGLLEKMRSALAFYAIGHEDEVRLSCQTSVTGDCAIEGTPPFNWYGEELKYTTRQPD